MLFMSLLTSSVSVFPHMSRDFDEMYVLSRGLGLRHMLFSDPPYVQTFINTRSYVSDDVGSGLSRPVERNAPSSLRQLSGFWILFV